MDRQLISEKTEIEINVAQDQAMQTKYHVTNYYKQKRTANVDSVHNLMRQWNTSYQHAQ
jgi:hypothetical protein